MIVPGVSKEIEYLEKRSRFISRCWGVESRDEVQEKLTAVRAGHPDATHVVYAFILGDINSEELGMSDDGEPKGTSGRPTLEVLKGSGIRNVLITTVRYFGGTKLGTGGLVRAYTGAAQLAVENTEQILRRKLREGSLDIDYEYFDAVKRIFNELHIENLRENFTENINIHLSIDENEWDVLDAFIRDLTRGKTGLKDLSDP